MERIVLSKALMEDPQVAQKLKSSNNRVYYDRFLSNQTHHGHRMPIHERKNAMANDDTEVVATLGNWTHVPEKADMCLKLQECIVPFIMYNLKANGYTNPMQLTDDQMLKFSHTHLSTVFKLKVC